jgi:hypothetical protein
MKKRTLMMSVLIGVAALATLAGCGTTSLNRQAMAAHDTQLRALHQQATSNQSAIAETASSCQDDMCRVAVTLAGALGRPDMRVQAPQLRSPGEEFARGFAPIGHLLNTGLQVWGAGWLVDQSGQNMVDLVGSVGSVVGNVQGPVDNSVTVGGNYGDTDNGISVGGNYGDTRGDEIGRDQIGGDQRIGDDVRGSCVGDASRNSSPGPIDNSDNSTDNPPPEPPDAGGG